MSRLAARWAAWIIGAAAVLTACSDQTSTTTPDQLAEVEAALPASLPVYLPNSTPSGFIAARHMQTELDSAGDPIAYVVELEFDGGWASLEVRTDALPGHCGRDPMPAECGRPSINIDDATISMWWRDNSLGELSAAQSWWASVTVGELRR